MANKLYKEEDVAKIAGKINSYTGLNKAYKLNEMADGVGEAVEQSYAEGEEQGKSEGYAEAEAIIAAIIDRSVTEINIPEVVTKIGSYAFCGCSYVVKFTIPDSVKEIGNQACNGMGSDKGTVEIIMPDSITTMGANAFVWSGVKKFVMSKNIAKIAQSVFGGCSKCELYDFSRYESIPALENVNAFDQMTTYKKAKIVVPPELCDEWKEATNWATYAGYINKPSEGLSYEIGYDSNYAVMGIGTCQDEVLIIPSEYQGLPVTSSDYLAFSGNQKIVMAVLPPNFYLSYGLFEGCTNLKKVVIPNSCQLFNRVFANCTSLEEVTIPSGTTYIDSANFEGCTSLRTLDFSKLTVVPKLSDTLIPYNEGMQILVPASLYDEWIIATNWAAYADYIVAAE